MNNRNKRKNPIPKVCQRMKDHPHYQAICWIVIILVISGILSVIIYKPYTAISAILASVCAGCITGIAFYAITNLRNNEKQAVYEEYKSIVEQISLTEKTSKLCISVMDKIIEGNLDDKTQMRYIKENTDKIILYMGTMFIDSPKTAKLIGDYPEGYVEKTKASSSAVECIIAENNLDKDQLLFHLCTILTFCSETKSILLMPSV